MAENEALLQSIGFTGRRLTDTLANEKILKPLLAVLAEAEVTATKSVSTDLGSLLYDLSINYPENALKNRPAVIKYVVQGKLNRIQLTAALRYMKTVGDAALDAAAFEKECGVGVAVSEKDVNAKVNAILDKFAKELQEKKYDFVQTIYGEVKKDDTLKWADGKLVSQAVDAELVKRIGEREKKGAAKPKKEDGAAAATETKETKAAVNEEELNPAQYRELRLKAVEDMRKAGRDPYPHKFSVTHEIEEIRTKFTHLKNGEQVDIKAENLVRFAGRITFRRDTSNKLIFYSIRGLGNEIQVMANFKFYEDKDDFPKINEILRRGDVVGIVGVPARSNTGELSVVPTKIELLAPCLHNMPHPETLTEMETRYRSRYLDLLVNEDAAKTFKIRSKIIQYIRRYFDSQDFLEVETPTMNLLAGGATAKPFVTYHNDLHVNLFMRIAPELYLKQLIIGGLDRVYEIGKNYRNEGIDLTHNPEFSAIEVYQAYADYNDMMKMTEELLSAMVKTVCGSYKVNYHYQGKDHGLDRPTLIAKLSEKLKVTFPEDLQSKEGRKFVDDLLVKHNVVCRAPITVTRQLDALALEFLVAKMEIDFTPPYPRIPMVATLEKELGVTFPKDLSTNEANEFLKVQCKKHGVECRPPLTNTRLLDKLVGHFIEPKCISPAFITDHPQMMSPLAKWNRTNPFLTERFEMFIAGREICNSYTELNDPIVQRKLFEGQSADRSAGDDEAQPIDEGFCTSMEYGLPPTGGWGLGIDRLVMILTDQNNIKEVLLFPAMKPLDSERAAQSQQLKFAAPAEMHPGLQQ